MEVISRMSVGDFESSWETYVPRHCEVTTDICALGQDKVSVDLNILGYISELHTGGMCMYCPSFRSCHQIGIKLSIPCVETL